MLEKKAYATDPYFEIYTHDKMRFWKIDFQKLPAKSTILKFDHNSLCVTLFAAGE